MREWFAAVRKYWLLKKKLHGIVRFEKSADISLDSIFEGCNSIGENSVFSGKMGFGSYMCGGCHMDAVIGRFTSIGAEVRTSRGTHPVTYPFATSSPFFFSLRKQSMGTFASKQCFDEILPIPRIGNDCWICDRVLIVGGVHVGDGAVVLPGAVVTADVPPYAVVGGVPASIKKYRYSDDTVKWLLSVKWWDKPLDWLQSHSEGLCDISKLEQELG